MDRSYISEGSMVNIKTKPDEEPFAVSIKNLQFLFTHLDKHDIHIESFNDEINQIEFIRIGDCRFEDIITEGYEIELDSGETIKCDPDTLLKTQNRGYVKASDLSESDEIIHL